MAGGPVEVAEDFGVRKRIRQPRPQAAVGKAAQADGKQAPKSCIHSPCRNLGAVPPLRWSCMVALTPSMKPCTFISPLDVAQCLG